MKNFIRQIYQNNLKIKPAVFLDRDGTIIEDVNYLHKPEQIKILPKVIQAIRKLNNNKILVIIITNQPVVAKGLLDIEEMKEINNIIFDLLKLKNAFIDGIYSCPHHPNADLVEFRILCKCRKPGIQMLKEAKKDFNVDIKNSYMIGDSPRDILAGNKFGITSFALKTSKENDNIFDNTLPQRLFKTLSEAVDFIINKKQIVKPIS